MSAQDEAGSLAHRLELAATKHRLYGGTVDELMLEAATFLREGLALSDERSEP